MDSLFVSEILKGFTNGVTQGIQLRQQKEKQDRDAALQEQLYGLKTKEVGLAQERQARELGGTYQTPTGEEVVIPMEESLEEQKRLQSLEEKDPMREFKGWLKDVKRKDPKKLSDLQVQNYWTEFSTAKRPEKGEERRSKSFEQGLEVPSFGLARTVRGADRIKTAQGEAMGAMSDVNELMDMTGKQYNKLSLSERARAQEIVQGLVGLSRLPYFGPGILTEPEQKQMRDIIADPTALNRLWTPSQRASLESIKQRFTTRVANLLEAEGVTDAKGSKLNYRDAASKFLWGQRRVGAETQKVGKTAPSDKDLEAMSNEELKKFLEN